MQIVKFKATKVFDYLDINLDLSNQLFLITGGNGEGKTTTIRLMKVAVTPYFQDLMDIPFSELDLYLI